MRIARPSPRLAPFIRDFMIVEVEAEVTALRLPEPGAVLGLRYSGSADLLDGGAARRLPQTTFTALLARARRMRTASGSGVVLARFRTTGARAFFAEPMNELFGRTWALDDILPAREVQRSLEQVCEATSDVERVRVLEGLLLRRRRADAPDALVEAAVRAIEAAHGNLSIAALANDLDISRDALEKRFRAAVGTSPKQHAMLTRLRHAVALYRPGARLTDVALEAGYYDQSHFNRALRAVTGESPTRFFGGYDAADPEPPGARR